MAMKQYQQLDSEIENANNHYDDQGEISAPYSSTCSIQRNGM